MERTLHAEVPQADFWAGVRLWGRLGPLGVPEGCLAGLARPERDKLPWSEKCRRRTEGDRGP